MELALSEWKQTFRDDYRDEFGNASEASTRPNSAVRSRPGSSFRSSASVQSLRSSQAAQELSAKQDILFKKVSAPTDLRPRATYGYRNVAKLITKNRSADDLQASPCTWSLSPALGCTASSICSDSWGPGWKEPAASSASRPTTSQETARKQHYEAMQKVKGMDHSFSAEETVREKFRSQITRHYKNIVSAWLSLDPQRNGRCLFTDVVRVAKECTFVCDVQKLWKALDQSGAGYVRLADIDAEAAALLQAFAAAASDSCGSAEAAWRRHFVAGCEQLRCRQEAFGQGAKRLGYSGDVEAVFRALNVSETLDGIVFEDFALLDKWFVARRSKRGDVRKPGIWDMLRVAVA